MTTCLTSLLTRGVREARLSCVQAGQLQALPQAVHAGALQQGVDGARRARSPPGTGPAAGQEVELAAVEPVTNV